MNGDEITNLNLDKVVELHKKHKSVVTHAATYFYRGSVVDIDKTGKITRFEYANGTVMLPMSIGIYVFNRSVLEYIPQSGSIEKTAFVQLVKEGKSYARIISPDEKWTTVDKAEEIPYAEENIREWGIE